MSSSLKFIISAESEKQRWDNDILHHYWHRSLLPMQVRKILKFWWDGQCPLLKQLNGQQNSQMGRMMNNLTASRPIGKGYTLGWFIKDTLKKNKNRNPVRNWGVPRKNISRRREWSNKSRGLLNTLKVWRKIGEIGRGIVQEVLLSVFSMQSPCSCGYFEMCLTYE